MGRKHCGKRRNCSLRAIPPFPTVFSKGSFPRGVIVWEWDKPFPNKPFFLCVSSTSLLKTLWEKEKLLEKSNFSFTQKCFLPLGELFNIFIKSEIVIGKAFLFLKFVVWKRVISLVNCDI